MIDLFLDLPFSILQFALILQHLKKKTGEGRAGSMDGVIRLYSELWTNLCVISCRFW